MQKISDPTPWQLAESRIRIAPSILAADFSRLSEEVARLEAAGLEMLHLDVMDGHFVPNISFGTPVIERLRPTSKLFFDAHLMILDPYKYAEPFAKAGCDLLNFHIEVACEPMRVIEHIRNLGVRVGITLNPGTPPSALEKVLPAVDLVLVMSVWPGFGGQKFLPSSLPTLQYLRERLRPDQRLEVDGGIDVQTIVEAARAGADTFVAGTAIFAQGDPPEAMHRLAEIACANRLV